VRKYAEGKLEDDRSLLFRGPDGKLNLRATNLVKFVQIGAGMDGESWEFNRKQGDC